MDFRKWWYSYSRRSRWGLGVALASVALVLVFVSGASITNEATEVSGAMPGGKANPVENPSGDVGALPPETFGVSAPDQTLADVAVPEIPDEARWRDNELVPPLPRDPELRRAAIEQARALSAAGGGRAPEVTYRAVVADAPVEPEIHSEGARSLPAYRPTEEELANINLGIPDDFEIPADVLRTLSANATIDRATESEMESQLAQALIQDFHGIDQTNLTPPDCDLAVSPNYIVLVVNAEYAVYDKCGTQLLQASLLSLGSTDVFLFDPKVIYDEWDNRWVMTYAAKNTPTNESWIRLAISSSGLPMGIGGHCLYSITWTNNGGWWGDYPDLGVDPDCVYITTNDFSWASVFQRARILVLDKAQVYACAAATRREIYAPTNPGDGTLAFAIRAAEMHSFGSTYFLINSKQNGGSILTHWEITGAPAAPVLNGYNIPVSVYDDPPPLLQPGGAYVDCGDARLLTANYFLTRLWSAHAQRVNWTEPADRSAIEVYIINTGARTLHQQSGPFGATGLYYAYPAVDFDDVNRGIVCFSRGGPTEFIGTRYADFIDGGSFSGSALLVAGQTNYAGGGSGTVGDPHRWGDYFGCDLDVLGDYRTLWFYGQFASSSPSPSWDTWVGAASFETAPALSVTPATTFVSTGLQGGPFYPSGVTYTLENTGGSAVTWTLTAVNNWNTASATQGWIGPGGSTNVSVNINGNANSFGPGTIVDNYWFNNCLSGTGVMRTTELTVGIDGSCPGAVTDLLPPDVAPYSSSTGDNQDRGVYVTALKDFDVCALGLQIDLVLPQTLTARIYAANGTTRGALLATGTLTAVQPGYVMHYIPISYALQSCQEYDIAVEFGAANYWDYWDDRPVKPFDAGGVLRIRDGEFGGDASNYALLHFSIIGSAANCPVADLDPKQGTPISGNSDDNQERGIYIKAEETVALCSLEWEANLVAPQTLTARVYEATGTTRGALLAEGTLDVTSSGMMFHSVPINYVLEEGMGYDLTVEFGTTTWWTDWDERLLTEPFTVGAIRVLDGEIGGNASNIVLPHFRVGYTPGVAGAAFDLAKKNDVYPPPNTTGLDNAQYGTYVRSLIKQEMYSLGWWANVPEGSLIYGRVYAATGTTRGALLSEGAIPSSGAGMRWHDIPVSVSLAASTDYDFAISFTTTNEWRWWDDRSGLPYDPYGVIRVVNGERDGDANNFALMHMRMNACNVTATAIDENPVQPPKFALMAPYPNPVSGLATIPFSLDESGPVTVTVYDVAGRRVATLLDRDTRPAGRGEIRWNAGEVAAGVYFVKLEANQKSVSRKIAIVR